MSKFSRAVRAVTRVFSPPPPKPAPAPKPYVKPKPTQAELRAEGKANRTEAGGKKSKKGAKTAAATKSGASGTQKTGAGGVLTAADTTKKTLLG